MRGQGVLQAGRLGRWVHRCVIFLQLTQRSRLHSNIRRFSCKLRLLQPSAFGGHAALPLPNLDLLQGFAYARGTQGRLSVWSWG